MLTLLNHTAGIYSEHLATAACIADQISKINPKIGHENTRTPGENDPRKKDILRSGYKIQNPPAFTH